MQLLKKTNHAKIKERFRVLIKNKNRSKRIKNYLNKKKEYHCNKLKTIVFNGLKDNYT